MKSSSSAVTPPPRTVLLSPFTPLVYAKKIETFFVGLCYFSLNSWWLVEGVLHLKEGESPPHGGKAGWAALPSPRIGPWLRLLKKMAEAHSLVPEFEVLFCFFVIFILEIAFFFLCVGVCR